MKTLLVCLANSQKFRGRCLAGVIITMPTTSTYRIEQEGGIPKWIRPVTNTESGELPEQLVKQIRLLEIIEINVINYLPKGHQIENALFDLESIKKVSTVNLTYQNLDQFINSQSESLFGNKTNLVSVADIINVSYSLLFIKVYDSNFYINNFEKIRVSFSYNGHHYDLPVTDKAFNGNFYVNNQFYKDKSHIYLTISLGVEFQASYYKLVSGVILI